MSGKLRNPDLSSSWSESLSLSLNYASIRFKIVFVHHYLPILLIKEEEEEEENTENALFDSL